MLVLSRKPRWGWSKFNHQDCYQIKYRQQWIQHVAKAPYRMSKSRNLSKSENLQTVGPHKIDLLQSTPLLKTHIPTQGIVYKSTNLLILLKSCITYVGTHIGTCVSAQQFLQAPNSNTCQRKSKSVTLVSTCRWYIQGQHCTLMKRSMHCPNSIPCYAQDQHQNKDSTPKP